MKNERDGDYPTFSEGSSSLVPPLPKPKFKRAISLPLHLEARALSYTPRMAAEASRRQSSKSVMFDLSAFKPEKRLGVSGNKGGEYSVTDDESLAYSEAGDDELLGLLFVEDEHTADAIAQFRLQSGDYIVA